MNVKKVISNIFYNSIYQLLLIALPLVTIPYVARVLGVKSLGINSYVMSIGVLLSFVILIGMNQLGVKTIAQTERTKESLSLKFGNLWGIQLCIGILVIVIYIIVASMSNKKVYMYANIPYLIGFTLDISWYYIGLGSIKKVILKNSIIKVLSVLLIFIFIRSTSDLTMYILINSVTLCIANIVFWLSLRESLDLSIVAKSLISKKYVKQSLILGIPQIAIQLYTSFDSTLVGIIAGAVQLTFYDQSQKIARSLLTLITSVSTVIMPKMAELSNDDGKDAEFQNIFKKSLDYTLIISLYLTIMLMINARDFVPWFFGREYILMSNNMFWVSLILIFIPYGGVFANQYALSKGMYKEYSIPYILGAVVSIPLNIILVHFFKADGGTLTIILTEMLVCMARIFMVRKSLELKVIFKRHFKYLVLFIFILIIGLRFRVSIDNLLFRMVINSVIYSLLYILLVFMTMKFSRDFSRKDI